MIFMIRWFLIMLPAAALCGNGIKDSFGTHPETCDDGNRFSLDGCSFQCVIEDPYICDGSDPDVCTHRCGDNFLETFGTYTETCDDGNRISYDGCSDICQQEDAYVCTGEPAVCEFRCGNGALDPFGSHTETCDDGNTVNGDGCSNDCQLVEDAFTCSRVDNLAANPDVCVHRCGNAALDPQGSHTEACDDGNRNSGDGCDNSCLIEDAYICTRVDTTISNPDICVK